MFDFEQLEVYKQAKQLNKEVRNFLKLRPTIHYYLRDQLVRAAISMVINIAEGSGKFSKADKRNFYTIARGSVYECASLVELVWEDEEMSKSEFEIFYKKFESISKMLRSLINSQY